MRFRNQVKAFLISTPKSIGITIIIYEQQKMFHVVSRFRPEHHLAAKASSKSSVVIALETFSLYYAVEFKAAVVVYESLKYSLNF